MDLWTERAKDEFTSAKHDEAINSYFLAASPEISCGLLSLPARLEVVTENVSSTSFRFSNCFLFNSYFFSDISTNLLKN